MSKKVSTKEVATIHKRNPKFKVYPGLSLKGKDILVRLKNRSLIIDPQGQYTLQEAISNSIRMSRVDIARASLENNAKIQEYKTKLESQSKQQTQP